MKTMTKTKKTRRMTMRTASRIAALAALCCLAACDSRTAGEFKSERSNGIYQEAMNDYAAGRLDAAAKGFEKAIRADPGNASARFQLACLLQDSRRDYLGAYCCYREYLVFAPGSDKAKMAKERLAICEKMFADELAKKANEAAGLSADDATKRLEAEVARLKDEGEKAAAALKDANEKLGRLAGENARLRRLMESVGGGEPEPMKQVDIASVKDLLDEEDPEDAARAAALDDAKALNALAEAEESAFGKESSLLPHQAADAKDKKKAAEDSERKMRAARKAMKDAIPDTYVVQEGDTLYKIATRFYGRTSAWKQIREANKDTISTDGRVRAGMKIRLPK